MYTTLFILCFGYDEPSRGYAKMEVTDIAWLRNGEPLIGIMTFTR